MARPHHRWRMLLACLALLVAAATALWMLTHDNASTAGQILVGTVSTETIEETFAGPGVIAPAESIGYFGSHSSAARSHD